MQCKARQAEAARAKAVAGFGTWWAIWPVVMEEFQGNNIPECWAEAWPQMSRAQQLVAVLRADLSPGNTQLWALASALVFDTLQTAWGGMASVVDGLEEE